jgi:hypothetical protein
MSDEPPDLWSDLFEADSLASEAHGRLWGLCQRAAAKE